jgi:hypothetical protein
MLLAAPTLSTLRIILRYVVFRLYDRDPFLEIAEGKPPPRQPRVLGSTLRQLLSRQSQEEGNSDTENV